MGDRPIAFGNFDIGGEGAVLGCWHSNFGDSEDQSGVWKIEKEWAEYNNRGSVDEVSNFIVEVLKTYGGL